MNLFVNALILALLVPTGSAQKVEDGPACRAELRGSDLLTTVVFPTGLQVEGPWRVVHSEQSPDGSSLTMLATLDRIVEKDALTGGRNVVPFPVPVNLAFEGPTTKELIHRAAQVWCVTVMRAQENPALQHMSPTRAQHTRVAALPEYAPELVS
jgi:hypothetical protein